MSSLFTSCALLLASAAPAPASTEAPAGNSQPASDDIIVTGEKADRTIQHTTTSVAVTTPQQIRDQAILSIQDVYNRTANVAETYGSSGFTIRGVNNKGVSGAGGADTATVYVDGAPLPSEALFGGPTDLWDVSQVEILRGPQSTIQGLNALAGSVVIETRDPTQKWSADGRALWSSQMQRTFSAAVGGPIVPGELAFRLAVEHRADRGIIHNIVRGGYDDRLNSLNLRGKLLWTPGALPDLTVKLGYNRVRRAGGYMFQYTDTSVPNYYDNRISQSNRPNRGNIATDIATADIAYRLGDHVKLSSITSWNRIHSNIAADADYTPVDSASILNIYTTRTLTEELRLNYKDDRLSGLLGGWYYHRNQTYFANSQVNVATPTGTISSLLQSGGFPAAAANQITALYAAQLPVIPVAYLANQPTQVETAAFFGDGRYKLTDRFSLIAGFRYDHERNRSASDTTATFTGAYPNPATFGAPGSALYAAVSAINAGVAGIVASAGASAPAATRNFNAFLPKGGISMDWTPHLTTAVTVQKGYRSGGSSQNPARSTLVAYDPEHTLNFEGALRGNWLDGRLTLNANLFYTKWTNQQVTVYRGLNTYDYNTVNAGKSHLWGFEVEAGHRFNKALDAFASVGHVKTRFDQFQLPTGTTSTSDLSGSQFAYAPTWTLAGGLNARLKGGWNGNINVNWRSSVFTSVGAGQEQYRVGARAVANGRVGYDAGHWGAYLFARNIFNARYKQYNYAALHQAVLGDPQTIGGEVDLHW
ncbi:TonB-dependent receptor [Novosphingobium rosa]|uniref:TonB-dependent receptor n=1 Tax=Novosphingobium rosa TaxID=76978 RepID=UPI00082A1C68|nr:TonB-dependent receptor [Novosphingobium rosa]